MAQTKDKDALLKYDAAMPELAKLIYLCTRKWHPGQAMGEPPHWMASHAEEAAHSLVRNPQLRFKFVGHTNRFLSRIYPGPVRIDSTNLDHFDVFDRGMGL